MIHLCFTWITCHRCFQFCEVIECQDNVLHGHGIDITYLRSLQNLQAVLRWWFITAQAFYWVCPALMQGQHLSWKRCEHSITITFNKGRYITSCKRQVPLLRMRGDGGHSFQIDTEDGNTRWYSQCPPLPYYSSTPISLGVEGFCTYYIYFHSNT